MTDVIDLIITPGERDLGSFTVRRVLPFAKRRTVGPFIFFDEMGPARLAPGQGMDVRPHPHIGLSTLTYLFDGEIIHRDSLGIVQAIEPGAVNWMTAGRGIVHSERTAEDKRDGSMHMHGIQTWLALPLADQEVEPRFDHYRRADIPRLRRNNVDIVVIAGTAYGATSPVAVFSPTLYCELKLPAGSDLAMPEEHQERAVYVVSGRVQLGDQVVEAGSMAVLREGGAPVLRALDQAHVMLIGGAALSERRHIWWNFVSASEARIEQAKADWRDGRFPAVPGDDEFIPLPEQ